MQWIYLFKHEQRARFSENQSTPKLENRKTTPCSPRAPNLLHMLPSRMAGLKELCNPGLGWSRCWGWARAAEQPTTGGGVAQVECLHSCSNRRSRCRGQQLSMYLFEGGRGAVASTSAAPEQNELRRCQRDSLIKLTLISFCISTDKNKMLFWIEWPGAFHENI